MTTRRSILQTLALTPALALAPKVASGQGPQSGHGQPQVQPQPQVQAPGVPQVLRDLCDALQGQVLGKDALADRLRQEAAYVDFPWVELGHVLTPLAEARGPVSASVSAHGSRWLVRLSEANGNLQTAVYICYVKDGSAPVLLEDVWGYNVGGIRRSLILDANFPPNIIYRGRA